MYGCRSGCRTARRPCGSGAVATGRHVELARIGLGHTDEVGHVVDAGRLGFSAFTTITLRRGASVMGAKSLCGSKAIRLYSALLMPCADGSQQR
jgi:hypothetical protein